MIFGYIHDYYLSEQNYKRLILYSVNDWLKTVKEKLKLSGVLYL